MVICSSHLQILLPMCNKRLVALATATDSHSSFWAQTGVMIHAHWHHGCTARRWQI
jgi:hypothetical protein